MGEADHAKHSSDRGYGIHLQPCVLKFEDALTKQDYTNLLSSYCDAEESFANSTRFAFVEWHIHTLRRLSVPHYPASQHFMYGFPLEQYSIAMNS